MSPQDYCYYLKGYIDGNSKTPNLQDWNTIQDNLNSVFHKKTKLKANLFVTGDFGPSGWSGIGRQPSC